MKWKRFTQEQIIAVLREHETGRSLPISPASTGSRRRRIYNWKAKCDGMDVSDAKRLELAPSKD